MNQTRRNQNKKRISKIPILIISSSLMVLFSLILILTVRNYEEKIETEQKAKEEQIAKEKVEVEQKTREEKLAKEKAEAEQKAMEEQLAIEKVEAEKKIKEEQAKKTDIINTAKVQLLGKKYTIVPSLYNGIDATTAMKENKAPQNLIHDGFRNITFDNDNIAHLELLGTYRPDMDTNYTLTENTLIVGQDSIPYSMNGNILTFDTWTTEYNGNTVTWSITPSN